MSRVPKMPLPGDMRVGETMEDYKARKSAIPGITLALLDDEQVWAQARVVIDYTNHRGERSERVIEPEFNDVPGSIRARWTLELCSTPHHPRVQWILHAIDVEKKARRSFAMANIHSWRPLA